MSLKTLQNQWVRHNFHRHLEMVNRHVEMIDRLMSLTNMDGQSDMSEISHPHDGDTCGNKSHG